MRSWNSLGVRLRRSSPLWHTCASRQCCARAGEVQAFLAAFLPTLALLIFLALLPKLCLTVSGMQGFGSLGEQSRDAFSRLFLFQFIWVFLGVTLGSSALALTDKIQEYASSPASLLSTVGGQLAESSGFFMICASPAR